MAQNQIHNGETDIDGKNTTAHPLRLAIAFVLIFGLAGCGSGQHTDTVMPNVKGQKLDVALSDIKRAGFENKVEVLGGGALGVIDESNWHVCDQSPAAGQAMTATPRLTVDRSCADGTPDSTTQPTTQSSTQPTAAVEILTVENSADLAAILAQRDNCSDTIAGFAVKYHGRIIEFDGNIAAMNNHGDNKTRYDILIGAGDYSPSFAIGPAFKFEDVGILDLHPTGSNVSASIAASDNLHIRATVGDYSPDTCLFSLNPVSTQAR